MKKNVASQVIGAQMVSATDGSNFTGSVTVYVTGDAGTQAAGSVGSGACTHEGKGFHTYAPAQAETNYDHVAFTFEGTGAVTATVQVYTSFPQTGDNFARLGSPAGASVSADIAAVKVDTAATLVDTNELQTDWADGGRLDLILDARASQASVDTIDNFIDTEIGTLLTDVAAILAAVDTEVGAIKAKTDSLTFTTANRVDSQVFGMESDTLTAAALHAGASTEIIAALFASAVEGAVTFVQSIRLANAALGGKASGLETTAAAYRNLADTKDRIAATVDADGNRTAVTLDLT